MRQWLRNDWIFSLTSKGRDQTKYLKILHGFTEKVKILSIFNNIYEYFPKVIKKKEKIIFYGN